MHTRYTLSVLAALTVLFGFATPAFASKTDLSSDPSYASGSFSFYCSPYIFSFAPGNHYLPTAPVGACTYSIPSSIPGSTKIIALYKGVPGNSILVSIDQVASPITLVRQNNIAFGAPANEQDYFGAVYDEAHAQAFADALRFGSTTPSFTFPASSTFALIPWKWGPKPTSELEPLLIVPDIFGSYMQDVGGVVDPIFHTYQNLIDTLTANGYILGQTLFTLPYNWESSNVTTANALAAKIQTIKTLCGCSQIDVVAHGMGGLVAEHYIKSASYQTDIDQLILLGTPLSGAPIAYRAWEAGDIRFGKAVQDGLMEQLLGAEAKNTGYSTVFGYIQGKPVSSFKELLPTFDYLYDSGLGDFIHPSGVNNTFLQNLVTNISTIRSLVRSRFIVGDDGLGQTLYQFEVVPSSQPPLWPEGQIEESNILTDAGDGVVARSSVEAVLGGSADLTLAIKHDLLPSAATSDTFLTLTGNNPTTLINNNYPVSCVLFVSTSEQTDLKITDPTGSRIGKNFADSSIYDEIPSSFYSGFTATTEYGAIANPLTGNYTIETQGTASGTFTLNASDVCNGVTYTVSTTSPTTPGQNTSYGVTVATTTGSITIIAINTKAPLTVTADNKTMTLGDTLPSLTATLSGFINGETLATSGVTGSASCTTTATASSPVGTYPITCTLGTLVSNKYEFKTFVPGTLTIAYRWDGFLQPINDTAHQIGLSLSVFKGGSTVPVKLQLKDAAGNVIQSATLPQWLAPTQLGPMTAPVSEPTYSDPATSGTNYEWDGAQYHYNWKTKGLASGFWYRIYAKFDDGTTTSVVIGLK